MAKTLVQEFTKGLWNELPPFRLVLGLCPTLGVTTTMENGLGMGVATTFVLICGNILVSLLRNIIPPKVRIACFIIVIASFVIIVELLMQAYTYPLFLQLGVFIPLIVVNCILLGRAEAFAYKNPVVPSIADGMGIGIGFTLSLGALGALRETFGKGTLTVWGDMSYNFMDVFPSFEPFAFLVKAPGAFVCLGLMLCLLNIMGKK
ncbi:MAG: electron transport complex subunit E [Desulfobacteraceae bacterium]|jgi:electron transport complex protein RnfE|nr:MAG: electron transport complex subunit E [Desulfobacteraceae bacterium]